MECSNSYNVYAPDSPTHYPYQKTYSHDVLDITLLHFPQRNYYFINHNELSLDHNLIQLSINNSPITSGPPGINKTINWKKFASYIENKILKTS